MASCIGNSTWQLNISLQERNMYMLDNEIAADITFKVSATPKDEPQTIRAHKYMLISASPVFFSMFCGELSEYGDVIVCNVDAEAFREMLRFIYTENTTLTGHNVMHILNAAKKYQLPLLAKQCADYLDKHLDASNACSVLDHSRFFGEEALTSKCMDIIEKNASSAMQSDDFLSISQGTLIAILDSDYLDVPEIDIFQYCYKWATSHPDGQKSMRDILGYALFKIRFPVMALGEFMDQVCTKELLTSEEELQVLKYTNSSIKDIKPSSFSVEPRKPRKPLQHHIYPEGVYSLKFK